MRTLDVVLALAVLVVATVAPTSSMAKSSLSGRGSQIRYGIGIGNSGKASIISGGYVDDIIGPLVQQYEFGAYFVPTNIMGAKSSAFGGYSIGLDTRPDNVVIRATSGVAIVTSPDAVLGGPIQFNHDLFLGVNDSSSSIGLCYKHISSAGIYSPNLGRDFLMVQASISW